jgi:4,5-dihydroxyphthalate decarboxylase
VQGAVNEPGSYGHPSLMPLLKPTQITPNKTGRSLSDLLETGEIAAIIGSNLPRALNRHPDVVRLFPDYRAREHDYFRRTRIFPIMHLIVIRNDLYDRHPFVGTSLYRAFGAAKDWAWQKMRFSGTRATCCRGSRPILMKSMSCLGAIAGLTASSRTGRRLRRW